MHSSTCRSAFLRAHKEGTVESSAWLPRSGTRNERTRSCSPGHLSLRVSPGRLHGFLECGFILHLMANAVIRAVSSVKGLKREQRRLFLGTLGQCLAPYQVLVLMVVLVFVFCFFFHTQNAQGGSLPREQERGMMEKQSVSLAGVPGIACVARLIFFFSFFFPSVVPGVNQSLKADRTAGRGRTTSRWTHRHSLWRTMGPIQP